MSINPITPKSMTNDLNVHSMDKQPRISDLLPDTPTHNKSIVLLGFYLSELSMIVYDRENVDLLIPRIEIVLGKLNKILDEYKMIEIVQKLRYLGVKINDPDDSFQEKIHEKHSYTIKVRDEILDILPVNESLSFIQGILMSEISSQVQCVEDRPYDLLIVNTSYYVKMLNKLGLCRYSIKYIREKLFSMADKLKRYGKNPDNKILTEVKDTLKQIHATYVDETFKE